MSAFLRNFAHDSDSRIAVGNIFRLFVKSWLCGKTTPEQNRDFCKSVPAHCPSGMICSHLVCPLRLSFNQIKILIYVIHILSIHVGSYFAVVTYVNRVINFYEMAWAHFQLQQIQCESVSNTNGSWQKSLMILRCVLGAKFSYNLRARKGPFSVLGGVKQYQSWTLN